MCAAPYALVSQEKQYPLQIGKNVVGRSSVPVEGVSFVNLESPLAAISRMQAFLDIAENGDAWISDCNSTNGTFLSIRTGPGIRLEANRYYQLSPGCQIVFGDVECTFEALEATRLALHAAASPAPSDAAPPARKTEPFSAVDPSSASETKSARTKSAAAAKPRTSTAADRGKVPYLDESTTLSEDQGSTPAETKSLKRSASASPAASKPRKAAKAEPSPKAAPKLAASPKTPARTTGNGSGTTTTAPPPHVCLTGMDSDERTAIAKRVRQLKGRVVEDITKANLLVVATPPVRTPKFIIAVARCIPIVSVPYICNDKAELADPRRHIVGLKTEQHTYSAAALEKVIYRSDPRPLLDGTRVNISALSAKAKAVATDIISSAGGELVRAKSGGGLHITDDQLDALYDSILRGKVPTSL